VNGSDLARLEAREVFFCFLGNRIIALLVAAGAVREEVSSPGEVRLEGVQRGDRSLTAALWRIE
jgi:hypothetical protein